VLDVKVFQEDELSGRSRVAQDGTVTLPLLGQVKVAGMSMDGAARHVHQLLENDYLVNPRVLITLVESVKPRFTILGQVQAPGMYELPEGEALSLLQAISLAGGYTRLANPARITLRRSVGGGEIIKQFDGKALAKGRSPKPERIQAGDTIYVPERVF
jgi:polysaccharide export outer membrane protein